MASNKCKIKNNQRKIVKLLDASEPLTPVILITRFVPINSINGSETFKRKRTVSDSNPSKEKKIKKGNQ